MGKTEFDNCRPLDLELSARTHEVDQAVDAIYQQTLSNRSALRLHPEREKKYLKMLVSNLFATYETDPSMYVRYSRNNSSYRITRYNSLAIHRDLLVKTADLLVESGYATPKIGVHAIHKQSRIRATEKLISLLRQYNILRPMVQQMADSETVRLRNAEKALIDYVDTPETVQMRENMRIINLLLEDTLVNLYLPDREIKQMITEIRQKEDEGSQDFTGLDFYRKRLFRVFNNGDTSFRQGGRFYGGFWQGIPSHYRKYLRIDNMNTVEIDYSAIHLRLAYWDAGLSLPAEDPYTLEGFPQETRNFLKPALLTMLNAANRRAAISSIKRRIKSGSKKKSKKTLPLPPEVERVDDIIEAFEAKHAPIKDYLYSGKGIFLQYWDSWIAEKVMVALAQKRVATLPLHDSFITAAPNARLLQNAMSSAFTDLTGWKPKMDVKKSLEDLNKELGETTMWQHYEMKTQNGRFTDKFKKEYSIYVNNKEDWKKIKSKDNIFTYPSISTIHTISQSNSSFPHT